MTSRRHRGPRRSIPVLNPVGGRALLWQVAQGAGLAATALLILGLVTQPDLTLRWFWTIAVPVLPALFLVNPKVWRNVCPLATLNRAAASRWGTRVVTDQWLERAATVGLVLFYLLVPARRFLFNTDGVALAGAVGAFALLPLVGGRLFEGKAGFCNGICPLLSVERLYGQRPFTAVSNARCAPCTRCTNRGCIDLSLDKSVAQTLGAARHSAQWLATPFGVFAASFPGFIYGYFTVDDGPLSSAPAVYGHVLLWTVLSYGAASLLALVWRDGGSRIFVLLGAAAAAVFYWYAAPQFADTLGLPLVAGDVLRAATLFLVGTWTVRGWRGRIRSSGDTR